MRRYEIYPRTVSMRGKMVWYVRVPKDLRSAKEPRMRFFGGDKKAASAFAKNLRDARMSVGAEFLKLPSLEQSAILNGLHEIGADGLIKAIHIYKGSQPASKRLTKDVVDECLAAKEKSGYRKHSLRTLKCSLKNFAGAYGAKPIHEVTTADVKKWVYENEWAAKTRLNYLKDAITLFKHCLNHQYVNRNPCGAVEFPKIDQKNRKIFAVAEIKKLLETMQEHDPGLLGYICPDLFGGIRPEESKRMTKKNVTHGIIDLSGEVTKKRKRRMVVMNETLKAWLSVLGIEFGGKNITRRMRRIRKLAGIKWAHDIVRHTFCSYTCAKFGKTETARLACTSEHLLESTYVSLVKDPNEVEAFWNLRPRNLCDSQIPTVI